MRWRDASGLTLAACGQQLTELLEASGVLRVMVVQVRLVERLRDLPVDVAIATDEVQVLGFR